MMKTNPLQVEVCFSTSLFGYYRNPDSIVVITDILRATSSICTAFHNGVKKIIPVKETEQAREYKKKGYIVAAERDGRVLEFADFGNSPFHFSKENVMGKTIVYSTTNGTLAVDIAKKCKQVFIGSFLNLNALGNRLLNQNSNVVILCSGWKGKFNIEDSLFAGALAEYLLGTGEFITSCDSTYAAIDLWTAAKSDVLSYIKKAAQYHRLKKLGLNDIMEFVFTPNSMNVVPVLENDCIVLDNEQ